MRAIGIVMSLFVMHTTLYCQQNKSTIDEIPLEEVVISDSGFALQKSQSGRVITKITADDLHKLQGKTLPELLNQVSGIYINASNNAPGEPLGVSVRGGRSRQVVIRVDGLTVSDPSSTSGEFDLRLISLQQIESIEILKGASSTLYGSGAATAVVNITTKKEENVPVALRLASSIGTNQSQEDQSYDVNQMVNMFSVNGTLGNFTYLGSFSNTYIDGLSAVEAEGANPDPFSKYHANTKIGYQILENLNLNIFGQLDRYKSNFDSGSVDGDNTFESDQYRGGFGVQYSYAKGSFHVLNSYSLLERAFNSDFPTRYESRWYTYDIYNKYNFKDTFYLITGINGSNSDFNLFSIPLGTQDLVRTIRDDQADFDIIDPYLNVVYVSKFGFQVNAGARLNMHSAYDTKVVYSINPSYTYRFDTSYIKGLMSYSTAYITPSLFQLYDTAFFSGNPNLSPEESSTMEVGVAFSYSKKQRVSLVYFNRTSKNFITFNPSTFANFNVSEDIVVDGLEFEASFSYLNNQLNIQSNFTYTNIDRLNNGIRIPKHMLGLSLSYSDNVRTQFSVNYTFNSKREDQDFSNVDPITFQPRTVSLDAYGLLGFNCNYKVTDHLSVYLAMSNMLNDDYQDVVGFNTRGRNASAGFSLSF